MRSVVGRPALFSRRPFLVGVIHLAPLPGSPRDAPIAETIRAAERDARAYLAAGFDGLIVENFGDAPFFAGAVPPVTIAAMALACDRIRSIARNAPVGVNVLRNDALAALSVAVAARLAFLRVNVLTGAAVTDQGILSGDAATLLRERARLGADVRIFADVMVKHSTPLRTDPVEVQVDELLHRALADAVLVTGPATGSPPDLARLRSVRRAAGASLVVVASGAAADNMAELGKHADGFIVGTAAKRGGVTEAPVDPIRARALARAVRSLR